jgi:hypothetical protein
MPNDLGYSELHLFSPNRDLQSTPEKFAWSVGKYLLVY